MNHQKIISTFLIAASVCATGAFAADGDNRPALQMRRKAAL